MALIPLSKTEPSRLHPDAFDVRGWEVRTEVDDDKAGSVDDVLMDGAGTPHLLDVKLGAFRKHVLVPLSQAWADASRQVVWIEGLGRDDLKGMPEYGHDPDGLNEEFERRLVDDYRAVADGVTRREPRPAPSRLARMKDLKEFRVAKGSGDPRGWTVIGGDGKKLGVVTEMIVDQERMRASFLDVDVDEEKLALETIDRHVLIPLERARLLHKEKRVVVDGLFARDLGAYPVYTGLPLAKGVEDDIRGRYRSHEPIVEEWATPAARRFFGGARRRPAPGEETPSPYTASTSAGDPAPAGERETIVLPREGEELRIRVSGGDVIIEKHPDGSDRDG